MNHLQRDVAPLSDSAWTAVEDEARTRLVTYLAARKLVDFEGPHGWTHSATNLGHVRRHHRAGRRHPGPPARRCCRWSSCACRSPSRGPCIDDAGRGAQRLDLDELEAAVRTLGEAENTVVFHGYAAAGIAGIAAESSHDPVELPSNLETYPTTVAKAVNTLPPGIDGPYGLAIGPSGYTAIIESTERGGLLAARPPPPDPRRPRRVGSRRRGRGCAERAGR